MAENVEDEAKMNFKIKSVTVRVMYVIKIDRCKHFWHYGWVLRLSALVFLCIPCNYLDDELVAQPSGRGSEYREEPDEVALAYG